MENNTVKDFIPELMVLLKKDYGRMVKELNGLIIIRLNKIDWL